MVAQISVILIFLITCAIALRWGGFEERLTAGAFILNAVITNVLDFGNRTRYSQVQTFELYADLALLALLLVLALRSDRFWPMWATAFQLVLILVHAGSGFQTGNFAWAYYVALIFWSFPLMLTLAAGTWLEARQRRLWDVEFR